MVELKRFPLAILALTCAMCASLGVLVLKLPARPPPAYVIRPGHEAAILGIVVGEDRLAARRAGLEIPGIQVEKATVVIEVSGPATGKLEVGPSELPEAVFLRTDACSFLWHGPAPVPDPVDRLAREIAQRCQAMPWEALPVPPPPSSLFEQHFERVGVHYGHGLTLAVILIALGALASGALLGVGLRRWPVPPVPPGEAEAPNHLPGPRSFQIVALGTVAVAVGLVFLMATRFRYLLDDFSLRMRAETSPWHVDESLRLLSTTLRFQVASELADPRSFFVACNLAALLGAAALWGTLVRRAGFLRLVGVLSAALFVVGPGSFYLLRWASGFEHLGGFAILLAVLLLIDIGARAGHAPRAWRAGLLGLALTLAALGVFAKYPDMLMLPISAWIWGRWIVREPRGVFAHDAIYLAFVLAVALPLYLAHPASALSGELAKAGPDALSRNLAFAGRTLLEPLASLGLAFVVVWGAHVLRGIVRRWEAQPIKAGMTPVPRRVLLAMAVLVGLWGAPFLLNAVYTLPYYVLLGFAPIAALAAHALRGSMVRSRAGTVVGGLALVALVPAMKIARNLESSPFNTIEAWLEEVASLTRGHRAPDAIRIVVDCPAEAEIPASLENLRELAFFSGAGDGVQWATGFREIPVFFDLEHEAVGPGSRDGLPRDQLVIRYCKGRPMRAER